MSASGAGRVQAVYTHDVLVIGSGVGGLTVAIETPELHVGLLTKAGLGRGDSSPMAQGGVAAAVRRESRGAPFRGGAPPSSGSAHETSAGE